MELKNHGRRRMGRGGHTMREHSSEAERLRLPRGLALLPLLAALWAVLLAAAPAAHAQATVVQGIVTFEKVPATAQGLRFNAIERRPAVAVAVQVVARTVPNSDTGLQVVGAGVTDDNGFYQ